MAALFSTWRESLELLNSVMLKRFLLITVRRALSLYRLIFTTGLWILLVLVPYTVYRVYSVYNNSLLDVLAYFIVLFFMVGFSRPSITHKNLGYLINASFFLLFFIPLAVAVFIISMLLLHSLPAFIALFITMHLSVWLLVVALFLLDSYGTVVSVVYSLKSALKMFVYNYPLYLLSVLLAWLFSIFVYYYIYNYIALVAYASLLIVPWVIALITNIYTKRVHEQFSIYQS